MLVAISADRYLVLNLLFSSHMCMVMRGVQKPGTKTITSCMLGKFKDDPIARDEFLFHIKHI